MGRTISELVSSTWLIWPVLSDSLKPVPVVRRLKKRSRSICPWLRCVMLLVRLWTAREVMFRIEIQSWQGCYRIRWVEIRRRLWLRILGLLIIMWMKLCQRLDMRIELRILRISRRLMRILKMRCWENFRMKSKGFESSLTWLEECSLMTKVKSLKDKSRLWK